MHQSLKYWYEKKGNGIRSNEYFLSSKNYWSSFWKDIKVKSLGPIFSLSLLFFFLFLFYIYHTSTIFLPFLNQSFQYSLVLSSFIFLPYISHQQLPIIFLTISKTNHRNIFIIFPYSTLGIFYYFPFFFNPIKAILSLPFLFFSFHSSSICFTVAVLSCLRNKFLLMRLLVLFL